MVIMTDSPTAKTETPIDLIGIEKDLADVEIALSRLEAGTYWTCEVTGESLSDELLASQPTIRRASHP